MSSLGSVPQLSIQPVVAASLLHCLSQGFLFAQSGAYASTCDGDPLSLKVYIAIVCVLALAQTIIEIIKLWIIAIFEEPWYHRSIAWMELFGNGLTCTLVEAFLIRRCWKVSSKSKFIAAIFSLLALSTLASNIYLAAKYHDIKDTVEVEAVKGNFAFSYWIFGSFALDISITTLLLVYLLRSKAGLAHLDTLLDRVIHITWESASLPTIFMIVAISLFQLPEGLLNYELILLFTCFTSKLYCHGLLRTLNGRSIIQERMHNDELGRQDFNSLGPGLAKAPSTPELLPINSKSRSWLPRRKKHMERMSKR